MNPCAGSVGLTLGLPPAPSVLCTYVDQQSRGLSLKRVFHSPRLLHPNSSALFHLQGLCWGLVWDWSEPLGKCFAKRQLQLTVHRVINSSIVNWT